MSTLPSDEAAPISDGARFYLTQGHCKLEKHSANNSESLEAISHVVETTLKSVKASHLLPLSESNHVQKVPREGQ